MTSNKWVDTFVHEAEDLLAQIEECALSLGAGDAGRETVNQLFRAFHTIKGSGAMCGLTQVAAFTHHVETLLDQVRNGALAVTPELGEIMLAARDHVLCLISAEQGGNPVAAGLSEALVARIEKISHGSPASELDSGTPSARPEPPTSAREECIWEILFRPSPDLLTCGGNPALLFRDLQALGACEIVVLTDNVPALEELQPSLCYLGWQITLRTAATGDEIRDVFLFVEDGSKLEIRALSDAPSNPAPPELERGPTSPTAAGGGESPSSPTLVPATPPKVSPDTTSHALTKESTVRVPARRLDHLVNLVGELVMNQSRLTQVASQLGTPELANPVQELERLVAELRDDVLGIRMLPIGTIFGRFRRLVHDLSAELGKEVDLVTEGAETELDKSVLDQLGEPLVHLLRNCVDHGIETAAERKAAGKPGRGVIRLTAEHIGSNVVVSIEDDGRGIDRAAVRAKAVQSQLIAPDAYLSDKEILNLILLPGFSTARQVTSVSGRGVGMDVVKRQIDTLRGSLSIASDTGEGTRISLGLPLTLAIIEGLTVQVGPDQFIVPMAAVTENVDLGRAQRTRNNGRNVIAVRGELVPYIDLRAAFHIEGEAPEIEKIVIVQHESERVGLVVDRVLGSHQTVLQPLGKFLRQVEVVSGATIMGNGCVALIMDIPAVVRFADNQCCPNQARAAC